MIEFLVFMGVILLISLSLGLVFWFIWITLGFIGLKETVDRHYKYLTELETKSWNQYIELRNNKADKPDPTKLA